uniref:7TM_GPCR_Srx domain-containing protein n=1 Tax=Panagrellus redivivus TaxID=6233 RepID=A0A7E4UZU2_PANRE
MEFCIYYFTQDVINMSHEESVAVAQRETQNAVSNYYNESTLICISKSYVSTNILFVIAFIVSFIFNASLIIITIDNAFMLSILVMKTGVTGK